MKKILKNLECIVPTLGGSKLENTISNLISGTFVPCKIILSLPIGEKKLEIKKFKKHNIVFQIIYCSKGQVKQRLEALKLTKKKYVLQLDDDIKLDKNCLKILYHFIKNKKKVAVAPRIVEKSFFPNKFKKKIHVCGKISKNGIAYPVQKCCSNKVHIKTDWLPGGCVLSLRDEMISKNFFDFDGKAYFEDLFNSLEREKKKITHFLCYDARAYVSKNHNNTLPLDDIFKYIKINYLFLKKYKKIHLSFIPHALRIIYINVIKNILDI